MSPGARKVPDPGFSARLAERRAPGRKPGKPRVADGSQRPRPRANDPERRERPTRTFGQGSRISRTTYGEGRQPLSVWRSGLLVRRRASATTAVGCKAARFSARPSFPQFIDVGLVGRNPGPVQAMQTRKSTRSVPRWEQARPGPVCPPCRRRGPEPTIRTLACRVSEIRGNGRAPVALANEPRRGGFGGRFLAPLHESGAEATRKNTLVFEFRFKACWVAPRTL